MLTDLVTIKEYIKSAFENNKYILVTYKWKIITTRTNKGNIL